jgi:hypothetical protein
VATNVQKKCQQSYFGTSGPAGAAGATAGAVTASCFSVTVGAVAVGAAGVVGALVQDAMTRDSIIRRSLRPPQSSFSFSFHLPLSIKLNVVQKKAILLRIPLFIPYTLQNSIGNN